jgi:RNA polymerase sigma factor (TIGR02999 family)
MVSRDIPRCGGGARLFTHDMSASSVPPSLATLVARADAGDAGAADTLFSALYADLHRLAAREVRRQGAESPLSATTLLHEVYLACAGREGAAFPDEARFLAYAAKAMRGVLIDRVRHRDAQRRGGGAVAATLDSGYAQSGADAEELVAIHGALQSLEEVDAALAHVVDLHFFCGFSFVEIAAVQGVSLSTVQRQWVKARTILRHMLDVPGV